jgi:hypothetical protein
MENVFELKVPLKDELVIGPYRRDLVTLSLCVI